LVAIASNLRCHFQVSSVHLMVPHKLYPPLRPLNVGQGVASRAEAQHGQWFCVDVGQLKIT
jgi:hypothetical protein